MEASGILGLTRLKRYRCWQCTLLGTAWREFAFFSRCGAGQTHIDDNFLSLCVRSPLQTISQKVVWANILSGEENSQNTFGILCLPLQNLKSYFRMRREDLGGATRYINISPKKLYSLCCSGYSELQCSVRVSNWECTEF